MYLTDTEKLCKIMFLHKLNLELQGKTALTYETHTAESDMTTNV